MKNTDNIEKLFKETFEHFEADVNPQVWANVQSGINSGAGSVASTAAKFAIGKIIAGAVAVSGIAGSVWYFSQSENKTNTVHNNQNKTEIVSNETAQNIVSENKSEGTVSNSQNKQIASSTHSSTKNVSDNGQQQTVSGSTDNVMVSDNSSADNTPTTSSEPAPKYGNATQGDGGMMRWNKSANVSSSNSNESNSHSDSQEEESAAPTANIFVNTTSGDAPLTVDFIHQGIASSLNWDFGDGSASRENFPSHTFDKPGTYVVTLNAKNSSGSVSDKVTIEVRQISNITNIPNIFTPNGDGENDMFFFEMKNINSIGVAIYSQKEGGLVYQWNSLEGNWNGKKMNGDDAPEGVYLYSIQAIGTDGVIHSEKGFVTLSRKR